MRKISAIGISLGLSVLLVVLAGCGRSAVLRSAPTATPIPTATSAPPATATTQPTPNTTVGLVDTGHPCRAGASSDVRIGDLHVSRVGFLLAYPANKLSASLDASKPTALPASLPQDADGNPTPPVNPFPNYGFTICNTSATTGHVLRTITVSIAAFSGFSGTLNTWMPCDGYYQRPNGTGGGGCGGGYVVNETLKADFAPGATTGARVTAAQVSSSAGESGVDVPPLPLKLGPGQAISFALQLTVPTAPGMYTFRYGLGYDNVTSATISAMQPTLFDSAAVKWSGSNCSALLAQIPTSDTKTQYICAP